jgi:hypothetical protein
MGKLFKRLPRPVRVYLFVRLACLLYWVAGQREKLIESPEDKREVDEFLCSIHRGVERAGLDPGKVFR